MPNYGVTIAQDVRAIIAEQLRSWSCSAVSVPASGSFVLERVLRAARPTIEAHGAGSTLISVALGSYLARFPFRVRLQPGVRDDLGYIAPSLDADRPAAALAAVILGAKIAPILRRDNRYYTRQREGYALQWPALHAKQLASIQAEALRLDSFFVGGVAELLGMLPPDAGVITHLGLWRPDTKQEDQLVSIFDWDRPDVADVSEGAARAEALDRLTDREHWIIVSQDRDALLDPWLVGRVQTSARGRATYVYASGAQHGRVVGVHTRTEPVFAPRLTAGQELAGELSIVEVRPPQFDTLRAAYLNASIRLGAVPKGVAALTFAVTVGGHIVGGFALSFDPTLCGGWDDHIAGPTVYLLSDFAVGPTDYPRLSKLVVLAALSKETQLLAERRVAQRWRSIVTTAFSTRPISMKYRGLMDLLIRNAVADSPDLAGGAGYKLTYGAPLGRWTLGEALARWRSSWGERGTEVS